MPFQPVNYANIEPQGSPWLRNLFEDLSKGYQIGQMPAQMERQKQAEQLKNAWQQMMNQEQPEKFRSDMLNDQFTRALQGANTNKINTMLPADLQEALLKNKWYDKYTQSQIDANEAMANLRNRGGNTLNAGGKEELRFRNNISEANPNLSMPQIMEADDVISHGGDTLSDGTKLNVTSDITRSLDRLTRGTTPTAIVSQGIQAAQASAEYAPLSKKLKELNTTIGSTIAGKSPEAVLNSYFNKEIGDDQMAAIIARGQMESAAATLQNRIETGQSFATIIGEILNRSGSDINARYAAVSPKARNKALDIVRTTMGDMYEARRKVPVGASSIIRNTQSAKKDEEKKSGRIFNLATGDYE